MSKKSKIAPTSYSSVQKTEGGETIQVSMSLHVSVSENKMMLADVLRSAMIDQLQDAQLPVSSGTYTLKALVTLTK